MSDQFKYKLAVVIVNYNVEYFLDQCLASVEKARASVPTEVIVVDNNSQDGSLKMLADKYPWVKRIDNKQNLGFSKANNQAIRECSAEYILLLNPDTVVPEDCFQKVCHFMDTHPEAGGLGVRMIDGLGNYLPESKRGLPRPLVAFYKMFGISKLFPRSKKFAKYHAGHIDESETAEIDVLSGAFMLLRMKALDKTGLLDEDFFMYGEDIDLSYRVQKEGYKNYYFPETTIIHYKGESTKKSSVNYVFVFYRAMVIFAKKHFSGKFAGMFSLLINIGIYVRAFAAIVTRLIKRTFLPLIDLIYIVGGLFLLTSYWKEANIEFPNELINYSIPAYAMVWLVSIFFNGGYDKPLKLFKYLKGVLLGTIAILVVYAVLPKSLQFSRLFIFIGAAWVLSYYFISRIFLHLTYRRQFNLSSDSRKNFLVVGSRQEFNRIKHLIERSHGDIKGIFNILPNELSRISGEQPDEDEIIFCSADLSYLEIIDFMAKNRSLQLSYKIAPENSDYLIGSNSIDTAGELYIININTLGSDENVRKKRVFDFIIAFALLLGSPVMILFYRSKLSFLNNVVRVLAGKISFIGFTEEALNRDVRLPRTKKGILSPCDAIDNLDEQLCDKLNILYARDYSLRKDFSILIRSWRKLDHKFERTN